MKPRWEREPSLCAMVNMEGMADVMVVPKSTSGNVSLVNSDKRLRQRKMNTIITIKKSNSGIRYLLTECAAI